MTFYTTTIPLVLLAFASAAEATISNNFRVFIRNTYGAETERIIARDDLGPMGSMGGGDLIAGARPRRVPIVFVHGVTQFAGDVTLPRTYFLLHGYSEEEYYATTYGEMGRRTKFLVDPMRCEYVKQVRTMLIAVSAYTNSVIDVIGFSMGSPISRKAILGGICVDTGEDLGPPLTVHIRNFLSIGGANHGTLFCTAGNYPECNAINGMSCGSRFYEDINSVSKRHYEGRQVFSLLSRTDEVIGYEVCGDIVGIVPGSDRVITLDKVDHYGLLFFTAHIQHELLTKGRAAVF